MSLARASRMIRTARRKKRITLRDLSKRVDASIGHLSLIENGERVPTERVLRGICREVGLEFDFVASLLGIIPSDVERYILRTPGVIGRLRWQMARERDRTAAA